MTRILGAVVSTQPIDAAELESGRTSLLRGLPRRWESTEAVAEELKNLLWRGGSEVSVYDYAAQLRSLDLEQVNRVARTIVQPDQLTWVIVGDGAAIRAALQGQVSLPLHELIVAP
jgi:zinc protease